MLAAVRKIGRDLIKIVASWRLTPNSTRSTLVHFLGWEVGKGSLILWGILPTTKKVVIGQDCLVGHNTFFDGGGSVTLEDYVRMGSFCRILTTTHPIQPAERRRNDEWIDLDTRIGFGSWLGAGVTVLPGVSIGRGCVIAAGAVVAQDTAPNGLYGGVPARRIKDLPVEALSGSGGLVGSR